MANETREHYFNKILLWNDICNEIINFGIECGITDLMDFVDMKCGAIPVGEYSRVIDPDAADQFLELYANIARKRYAFAVTQVLKMGPKAVEVLNNFCHDVGKNNGGFELTDASQAYQTVNSFLLDELPGQKFFNEVIQTDADSVKWQKVISPSGKYWTEAKGNFNDYEEIKASFINGLLDGTGFSYGIISANLYTIKR